MNVVTRASDLGFVMGSTGPRTSGLLHVTKSKAWTLPKAWLKRISHWTSMIPPCLRLFGSMVCPDKSTLEVKHRDLQIWLLVPTMPSHLTLWERARKGLGVHFDRIAATIFELRYRIAMISHLLRTSFRMVSDMRDTSFASLFAGSPVRATTILHNSMACATMSAFPRVFAIDGTCSFVSLAGMTLLRNLLNHKQVLKVLRDELATPSLTEATLPLPVFWRRSTTSACCRWNN